MDNNLFSIFPQEHFIDLCLYQYGREKCKRGYSFGPATRNHYLFHYVISGTGTLMSEDSKGQTKTYHIRSGQGFLIFPNVITTYIADISLPWEYTWIEFDGLHVQGTLNLTNLSIDSPIYHPTSKLLKEKLLNEMIYITEHPQESPLHQIAHTYLFFDYLTSSCRSQKLLQSGHISDFYIKEAISFIEHNFQNDITVEDIATVCGINRSYLCKVFKKSLGQSPQEFLIKYRMGKATELLKLTTLSIADIGKAVGYENQLHFSRAFKSVHGVSPKIWRRNDANEYHMGDTP